MSIVNATNDDASVAILVLHLRDGEYREVIKYVRPEHAVSKVLEGFRMDVEELFAKARA